MAAPSESLRSPPANLEAEQALLGAILMNNRAFDAVAEWLEPEHFAQGVHGRVFAAMRTLIERGEIANPVTLKNMFDQDESLAEIGGSTYLARLATSVVTVTNAGDYGRTIYDCWLRRELIAHTLDTAERAYTFDLELDGAKAILETLEQTLYRLGETRNAGDGPIAVARASYDHVTDVQAAYKAGGKPLGLQTGLADLDRFIGGLQEQELIILGGRPSMGKSLLAGRIAWNIARRTPGVGVLIFSLEQARRLWVARWLASTTSISTDRQYAGDVDANDWSRLVEADADLRRLPLWIDDAGGLTVGHIRHRARRQARKAPVGLIIADHLGLIRGSREAEREGKTARVSEVSRDLKQLAKELRVPVLALSQLNRGPENRDDKRPTLGDLRESGTIEQDADVVLFAYRHAYYLERPLAQKPNESEAAFASREADHAADLSRNRNIMEVAAAKNRHGPVGTARLFYDGERCIVADLQRGAGDE